MNRTFAVLAACTVACVVGALSFAWQLQPKPLEFESVAELRALATARGLHCVSLNEDKEDLDALTLIVSTNPITKAEIDQIKFGNIHFIDLSTKVCVYAGRERFNTGVSMRHWGNVTVCGDDAIAETIERMLR